MGEWLEARGLGRYAGVLAENEVNMSVLGHLTLDDLKEMPIKQVGARRALLVACAEQRLLPVCVPPPPPTGGTHGGRVDVGFVYSIRVCRPRPLTAATRDEKP